MTARQQMTVDRAFQQRSHGGHVERPELRAPIDQRIAAPYIVDENVEATVVALHSLEERSHFILARMIGANRNPDTAMLRNERGCLFDRFGSSGRCTAFTRAASGAIDRRTCGAQHTCNAAPGAARCTGNDGDLPRKLHFTVIVMRFDTIGGLCGTCT